MHVIPDNLCVADLSLIYQATTNVAGAILGIRTPQSRAGPNLKTH